LQHAVAGPFDNALLSVIVDTCRAEASSSDLTSRTFVAAAISEWPPGSAFPLVSIRTSLGPTGDIEAGTAALLAGEGIREQDFSLEVRFHVHFVGVSDVC
jgi:exoribonuclease R